MIHVTKSCNLCRNYLIQDLLSDRLFFPCFKIEVQWIRIISDYEIWDSRGVSESENYVTITCFIDIKTPPSCLFH